MREVSLDKLGFENTTLREDGSIICFNGKVISEPYGSGQVRIPKKRGGEYVNLAMLVAKYFVENPNYYQYISFLDGNKANCAASNIEWVEKRVKTSKYRVFELRAQMIPMHLAGKSIAEIAKAVGLSVPTTNRVIREFEDEMRHFND